MLHLDSELKTIRGKRVVNQLSRKRLEKGGFLLKNYKKLPAQEVFIWNGMLTKNADFRLLKFFKNKKSNDYYIIQGDIVIPLVLL